MSLALSGIQGASKQRFLSREIRVGNLKIGGQQPVVIQSMTTTNTGDIEATVRQVMELAEVGCQVVRITTPTIDDALALEKIKKSLQDRGVDVPLVADVHFLPRAADIAADFVEKVRINPGNFADRKMFKEIEYTDAQYDQELVRVREKFEPLVLKLKRLNRALRIGTNHGSLSDRVMNRFGDTPRGMVESAFEYAQICRDLDFHNFCFSMKASNVRVMIEAYRLLVQLQQERGWDYPIHLGVTEAGEGEDARIKSSIGIGTLLAEGIGDTIRVSLTEDSIHEIPVARAIAERFPKDQEPVSTAYQVREFTESPSTKYRVWVSVDDEKIAYEELQRTKLRPDVVFLSRSNLKLEDKRQQLRKLFQSPDLLIAVDSNSDFSDEDKASADFLLGGENGLHVFDGIQALKEASAISPERSVVRWNLQAQKGLDQIIEASFQLGTPFVDLPLSGIWIEGIALNDSLALSFGLLQATRRRMSKTEYIACPSCGRTLFDLQETTARIKKVTSHLKDVKIAIMGCIVNGPGEMADADFGYVGGAPGKVNLYVGKNCVERNIASAEAPDRLVELIRRHGMWVEPTQS